MAVGKNRNLTIILEWFLYIILVAGIGFLLVVLGIAPSPLVEAKLMFIIPHKILGYIFFILVLYHAFIHRKWYKAWTSGKIRSTKSNQITKRISILFFLMLIFFSFEGVFPRKIFALGHSIIGLAWIFLMISHIRIKRSVVKKSCRKVPNHTTMIMNGK